MDASALQASYEAVPYESQPIAVTHPGRIAAIARLHGLTSPPVEKCRVLELGCAAGGNLIPMALGLPDSTFVGVDFANAHIDSGRAMVSALGVSNVSLEAMSITDIDESFGTFDYIICHGVYSWVPPEVQAATLRVCAQNLSPTGVAYVSYNTYPGWHVRRIADDMIRFHDDPALSAQERADRGRAFVAFVADSAPPQSKRHADILRHDLGILRSESASHFLHEQLELVNEPVHFETFAHRAADVGLQYIAEAQPSALTGEISSEARATVRAWSTDMIRYEQYLDFLRFRTFRRTLLCHQGVRVGYDQEPAGLLTLHLDSRCEPVVSDDPRGGSAYRTADGVSIHTDNPFAIAALNALHDVRPATLEFTELWRRVRERMTSDVAVSSMEGPPSADDPMALAEPLLQCVLGRLVEAHACPRRVAREPSARPLGSHLARYQAPMTRLVTNLRHVPVELTPFDRFVLVRLDGTRDRDALVLDLLRTIANGAMGGVPRQRPEDIPQALDSSLGRLARAALLEA